ncbi:MAG: HD domain-containing protein [Erysipelotrichaceae bacterium]|nr:HD domain-containing protein [Erysipelotrichaceae bacterium]
MNHEDFRLSDYKMFETRVFRDVIHGYITVEYWPIWKLINTSAFQRLRRIKQLGGVNMVFQTAEHSRFVHSLGVYEVARRMLDSDDIDNALNDYEKLCVLCAALLHDVGHGPYSHSFEQVIGMRHEIMSVRIIREDDEISSILSAIDPDLPMDVANVIDKKADKPVMVQMISSQLDADRMDYLLRDSYFAGVTYGQFDMSRILRTVRVCDNRLVFKESGIQAIEDYMLARYYTYWQVYYHPIGLSYEHLIHAIMNRLKDLKDSDYCFKTDLSLLWPVLDGDFSVAQYLRLDEVIVGYLFECLSQEDDFIVRDLSRRLINRQLLKTITWESDEQLERIKRLSDEAGYDHKYYVFDDKMMQVFYENDAPNSHISEIDLLEPDGTIHSLLEKSEIVQAIVGGKPKQDAKIFYVKEIKEKV